MEPGSTVDITGRAAVPAGDQHLHQELLPVGARRLNGHIVDVAEVLEVAELLGVAQRGLFA